jgi:aspartate/methionine/tyrosine aminotransferase
MQLPPFQLERYFARYEFSAPYLLCTSDCESLTLKDILDLEDNADKRFNELGLGYTEALGHPELRRAIAGLYDPLTEEQVLVHAGAEEAIFNFMNVALNPGDEVIVQSPCYQSLAEVARGIGARVKAWQARPETGWALELAELEQLLTERTRVVVVNFPHNPTGYLPPLDLVHQLVQLSQQHGFIILADEVYRGLELNPADRLPALAELDDRAVSIGVMSKTYGLAGLRIGWVVTRNQPLFDKLAAFKDYTTICNSAPSEFLAALALRHANSLTNRNRQIISTNLELLDAFFAEHEQLFGWSTPLAGPIAFPELRQGQVATFCQELVEKAGVLLLPGTLYSPELNAFRIGFGRANMPVALDRFDSYLRSPSFSG